MILLIPTMLVVTVVVFLSVRFIPGNVVDMMIAQMGSSGGSSDTGKRWTSSVATL
ncbi:MAG: hypothetical protein ACRDGF_03880 [Chloroflexota bacterium]